MRLTVLRVSDGQRSVRSQQSDDRGQRRTCQGAEEAAPWSPRDEALDDAVKVQAIHAISLHGSTDDPGVNDGQTRKWTYGSRV